MCRLQVVTLTSSPFSSLRFSYSGEHCSGHDLHSEHDDDDDDDDIEIEEHDDDDDDENETVRLFFSSLVFTLVFREQMRVGSLLTGQESNIRFSIFSQICLKDNHHNLKFNCLSIKLPK